MKHNINNQIFDQSYSDVWNGFWNDVRSKINKQSMIQVETRPWNQVYLHIFRGVWDQVGNQIKFNIGEQIKDSL